MHVPVHGLQVGGQEAGLHLGVVEDPAVEGVAQRAARQQGVELLKGAPQRGVVRGLVGDDVVPQHRLEDFLVEGQHGLVRDADGLEGEVSRGEYLVIMQLVGRCCHCK